VLYWGWVDDALTGGAVPLNYQVINANSLYDPDNTGAGTQPPGFDQWMSLYTKYEVIRASCKANVAPSASSNGGHITAALSTQISTDIPSSFAAMVSRANGQISEGLPSGKVAAVSTAVDVARFTAINRGDPTLKGIATDNPATRVYFVLSVYTKDGATQPAVGVSIVVRFEVEFSEPVDFEES